jgi:hypothetical protein
LENVYIDVGRKKSGGTFAILTVGKRTLKSISFCTFRADLNCGQESSS